MSKVITLISLKGGVGKSTSSTALAAILSERGYKTLLIDCDQQCNSTDTFSAKVEGVATIYDIIIEDKGTHITEAIQKTECGDIVAGDPLLRDADAKLNGKIGGFLRLSKALKDVDGYDYIIIDTAPNMNSVLHNCLIASDEVIIPMTADRYALLGLSKLNEIIGEIREWESPKLSVAGLLLTKYNGRGRLSRDVRESLDEVARSMNTRVFDTVIRECVRVREAQAQKKMLISYAPSCTASEDYKRFADELLSRDVPVEICSCGNGREYDYGKE